MIPNTAGNLSHLPSFPGSEGILPSLRSVYNCRYDVAGLILTLCAYNNETVLPCKLSINRESKGAPNDGDGQDIRSIN